MKKLIYLMIVVAAGLSFTSCGTNNDSKYGTNPQTNGKYLFMYAAAQHSYAMDPVDIAFRFGILLREATDNNTTLNNVSVAGVKLIDNLFAGANLNIYKSDQNVYRLTFPSITTSSRRGSWVIYTHGKQLDELTTSDYWEVKLYDTDGGTFQYANYSAGVIELSVTSAAYTIIGREGGGWNISCNYFTGTGSSSTRADWSGMFSLEQSSGMLLTYHKASIDTFTFNGAASGISIYSDQPFSYEVTSPVTFVPKCAANFMSAGKITAGFSSNASYDPDVYPARTAELNVVSTGCYADYNITYDGVTSLYTSVGTKDN